jgi:hypothetical protein
VFFVVVKDDLRCRRLGADREQQHEVMQEKQEQQQRSR